MRRFSWLLLSQNAQVKDLHDGVITIGFTSAGAAKNFSTSGADEILHQALIDELGVEWRVEGIIDGPGGGPGGSRGSAPARPPSAPPSAPPDAAQAPPARGPAAQPPVATSDSGADLPDREPPAGDLPGALSRRAQPDVAAAKGAIRRTRSGSESKKTKPDQSADVSDDDAVIDDTALSSHELLARELGAQVIEDIRDDVAP